MTVIVPFTSSTYATKPNDVNVIIIGFVLFFGSALNPL